MNYLKVFAMKLGLNRIKPVFNTYHHILRKYYHLPNQDVQIEYYGGKAIIWNPSSSGMGRSLYRFKMFEPKVTKLLIDKIRKGMTVVDVGADMGYYTLIFSKNVAENGLVIAFEPITWGYRRLEENIMLNNIRNVKIFNFALFDNNGEAKMMNPQEVSMITTSAGNTSEDKESLIIKMRVFDQVLEESNFKKIDFVKIDCEGAELNILKGMRKTIEMFKPDFLIEIHPKLLRNFGYKEDDVYMFLSEYKYKKILVSRTAMEKHFYFTAE